MAKSLLPETRIVDNGSGVPVVANLFLLGKGGAATFTGVWTDIHGNAISKSFSVSIPVADGTNAPIRLTDKSAVEVPDDAAGVEGRLDAACYFVFVEPTRPEIVADFQANYSRYREVAAFTSGGFGRGS